MSELIGAVGLGHRLDALKTPQMRERALRTLALSVTEEAKQRAPRRTGNLARTIRVRTVTAREAVVVASANYAPFVEYGTGIYGPTGQRIRPKAKKVLAWRTGAVRLSGRSRTRNGQQLAGWAFARSVKGSPARPFMGPGAKAALAKVNRLVDDVIAAWNGAA